MKSCHAAALALVGWYLMTPPVQSTKCWNVPNEGLVSILNCYAKIDSQAPLREWKREPDSQEFECKTDCQRAISKDCYTEVEQDGTKSQMGSICYADCIAADDPRLKKK